MKIRSVLLSALSLFCASGFAQEKPNVLFIAIDDLNDWVASFEGHPRAKTPHLDAFAETGAIVFQNAHCAAPVCGPSRSALLSGFMPNRSGIYGNSQNMLDAELVKAHATLPEYFSKNGYHSLSMGKIYHAHHGAGGVDKGQWAFDEWHNTESGSGVNRDKVTSRDKNLIDGKPGPPSKYTKGSGSEFSWGPTKGPKEETSDYKTALWAAGELEEEHEKPFFMAVGLSKPHLPFYSPQEFFDLYDPAEFTANEIREDDLNDILKPNGEKKFSPTPDYLWLKENGLIDEAALAYMAACSYADACLGVILEALKKSPHYENTIVMLWGDHGWHLGEKLRYRKVTGWSESTRVPLMVRLPGMTERQESSRAVNLIDLYPTLIDLCDLPDKPEIDGRSFAPLLNDPQKEWNHPTLTLMGEGNASVVDERWRYIRYLDGTEEVYDLEKDPMEFTNLSAMEAPEIESVKVRLGAIIPETFVPGIGKQSAAEKEKAKKQGKGIDEALKKQRDLRSLK
ncbi:MAG: sulfatase [Verrucomicrobiales bacterium]|nr:sulfatase [Verrucomicrobiales bacterium]